MRLPRLTTQPQQELFPRFAEGGRRLCDNQRRHGDPQRLLVTIITATFNSAGTLRQCLESVAAQTYGGGDIEHLVIDGGSTDGTLEILREADQRGLLAYFVSEKDSGVYAAMNKGLDLATGEIIAFLNSDDWYEPAAVATMVQGLLATQADYAYGEARLVDPRTERQTGTISGCMDHLYFTIPYSHQALFCRRRCFETIGCFDVSFLIVADYDFMWRLVVAGLVPAQIDAIVVNFRTGGLSTSETRWQEEFQQIQQKHAERIRQALASQPGIARPYCWKSLAKLSEALEIADAERRTRVLALYRETFRLTGLLASAPLAGFTPRQQQFCQRTCDAYTSLPAKSAWRLRLVITFMYYEDVWRKESFGRLLGRAFGKLGKLIPGRR